MIEKILKCMIKFEKITYKEKLTLTSTTKPTWIETALQHAVSERPDTRKYIGLNYMVSTYSFP